MKYNNFKKYYKRIIQLNQVIKEEDHQFKADITESQNYLQRTAMDLGYLVPVVNLKMEELLSDVPGVNLYDKWNRNKLSTRVHFRHPLMRELEDIVSREDREALRGRVDFELKRIFHEYENVPGFEVYMPSYSFRYSVSFILSMNLKDYPSDLTPLCQSLSNGVIEFCNAVIQLIQQATTEGQGEL